MFGYRILLTALVTVVNARAPPYVQSREAFMHTRTYISEYLPSRIGDIYDAETQKHLSFSIITGVTAGLVMADKNSTSYHPLLVVDKYVPYSWRNYDLIAEKAQLFISEASIKVRVIGDLIDALCNAEGIGQCNTKVNARVIANPRSYKLPAELLLQLGKVSAAIRRLQPKIDSVTKDRYEIPYLIENVESVEFENLVMELEIAYSKLKQLQHGRSDSV